MELKSSETHLGVEDGIEIVSLEHNLLMDESELIWITNSLNKGMESCPHCGDSGGQLTRRKFIHCLKGTT